jgi:repressor LexA
MVIAAPANSGVQCHECAASVVRNPPRATIVAAHHFRVGHQVEREAEARYAAWTAIADKTAGGARVFPRVDAVRRTLYPAVEHTFVHRPDPAEGATVELTGRQQEIWTFLVDYVDRHGYPPTVREIGDAVGLASPSTVHAHLANLERIGLLRRDPTKPRALELTGREKEAVVELPRLPLLGQIAAGGPLLAEQNVEDEIAVPETLRGDFLLRVKGDSMIEAGILEGDVVVVRRAQDARNGEIVVALAGDDESADEATVKTFYREGKRVRLQPENSALEPIYAPHVQVLGKVVGVFREL